MTMAWEFTLVNAVSLLVGIAFLFNGYLIFKRGREDVALLLLSTVVGLGLIFVALFEGMFDTIAQVLGLEWKARAILVLSNLTLFVLVTYLFNRIGKLYERLSRVNEELSLLKQEREERTDD